MEENNYTVDYILERGIDKTAYGFIYITTNLVNGRKYIGKKLFKYAWKTYLGSGVILKKSIIKHGRENFNRTIVAITCSKFELDKLEIEFIKKYNATTNNGYYNISKGGDGGAGKTSNETKLKMSKARMGTKLSQETKNKISSAKKGIKFQTDESKKRISDFLKGNKHREGKKLSEEHINKIIKSNSKKVICISTMRLFDSTKIATDFYNIKSNCKVSECCRGVRKSIGKHPITGKNLKWMYLTEYIEIVNKEMWSY